MQQKVYAVSGDKEIKETPKDCKMDEKTKPALAHSLLFPNTITTSFTHRDVLIFASPLIGKVSPPPDLYAA